MHAYVAEYNDAKEEYACIASLVTEYLYTEHVVDDSVAYHTRRRCDGIILLLASG